VYSLQLGGVNLTSSTPSDASGKEVTSADYVSGQITETKNLIPTKSEISGMGMPSDKYIDLTIGTSGSTYTAPANGWFAAFNSNSKNGGVLLRNTTNGISTLSTYYTGFSDGMCYIPCRNGDVIYMKYTGTFGSSTGWFRFVYAQGNQ